MLLCIDVGNTNITLGLYEGETLGAHWRLATDHDRMPDEFAMQLIALFNYAQLDPAQIQGVSLASVVPPLTGKWVEVCRNYLHCEPLVVDGNTQTGLRILYDNPQAVGADRIVDAVAAFQRYGGPACIVDFGTATTFDAINEPGEYLGGAIAPGIGISSEALFQRAAKLPKVDEYCVRHYGKTILNISEQDRTFSVAKLFFAYGLGNGLYFPLAVSATTILHPGPPTPPAVYEIVTRH